MIALVVLIVGILAAGLVVWVWGAVPPACVRSLNAPDNERGHGENM